MSRRNPHTGEAPRHRRRTTPGTWRSERDNRGGFEVTIVESDGVAFLKVYPESGGDLVLSVADLIAATVRAARVLESYTPEQIISLASDGVSDDHMTEFGALLAGDIGWAARIKTEPVD